MKHKFFALIFVLTALAAVAADSFARVSIYPVEKFKVPLSFIQDKEKPLHFDNGNWCKDPAERKATLFFQDITKPLSAETWTTIKGTFRAEESGKVQVSFHARYAEAEEARNWALVRNIRINGKPWVNYDLKQTYIHKSNQKVTPKGFWMTGKQITLQEDAGDGKAAVLVNHDNRLNLVLEVKEGETYTIEADYQAAFAPLF